MKIDIFNHFFPKAFHEKYITKGLKDIGKRVQLMPTIADLDARFRVMDEFGRGVNLCLTLRLCLPCHDDSVPRVLICV